MIQPTLIVVSGPPGTGKTTLAHALARVVCCPAVCRDEIKEGMVHSFPGFTASLGDPLTLQATKTFFAVLDVLIDNSVTLIAEAAFQDGVWRPALERFIGRANIRVVRCHVDSDLAHERIQRRMEESSATRSAHADAALSRKRELAKQEPSHFVAISLDVPILQVDTTSGYRPELDEIAAFARAPSG